MTSEIGNYRTSAEYKEILRILQRASALQENIVWQSLNGSKNIIPVHHVEIDFVSREVVIYFDSTKTKPETGSPLYVKLDYRMSVFKVTEFKQGQGSVSFPFPKEIKTRELRADTRTAFGPNDEVFATLRSSPLLGNEIRARVYDVSSQGLGLIISEQNRSFFKTNRILWVTGLQGRDFPEAVLAEVVYINTELDSKFQNKRQKDLKVGLKLSQKFPQ